MTPIPQLPESFWSKTHASSKFIPHPSIQSIVYLRGKPYLDFKRANGKRIRYNLDETCLQRCIRLGILENGNCPKAELELLCEVVEQLGNLKPKPGVVRSTEHCQEALAEPKD